MDFVRRILSSSCFSHKIKEPKGESSFLENGGMLLAEFVTQWNGRSKIPIRNFSAQEVATAVNNFDVNNVLSADAYYKIYRGYFGKRPILVKKYHSGFWHEIWYKQLVARDMVISSQMSVHKNVLKVIGCCLDFENPALVYQCPEASDLTGPLFYTEGLKLTWQNRLSIASDIANVFAYLHSAFRTPILHRGLMLHHVVIDWYGSAKISDFLYCIPIPLGESQVEDAVVGTYGHMDPKYAATGIVTVKADVYNMGVILFELLRDKKPWDIKYKGENFSSLFEFSRSYTEDDKVRDIVNSDIVMEGKTGQDEQFRAFAALALRCIAEERDDRPEMVDVVRELRRIQIGLVVSE